VSDGGVSAAYVDAEIAKLEKELRRLEVEMAELARAVVDSISAQTETLKHHMDAQTAAMVAGVAATTVMIERTKSQIESDFQVTQEKLALQMETALQVEIGKKVADIAAAKTKLDAFRTDVENRFLNSVVLAFRNRALYNAHFQKIHDEYQHKLKTIGESIFRIRDLDMKPAVDAAMVEPERTHGLPIEVDLYRLQVRAENLDQSLQLLKSSRLDDILNSTQRLEGLVGGKFAVELDGRSGDAVITGIGIASKMGTDVVLAAEAQSVTDKAADIRGAKSDLSVFAAANAQARVRAALEQRATRQATNDEIVSLAKAALRLQEKKLISEEAYVMFEDFLGRGTLNLAEGVGL